MVHPPQPPQDCFLDFIFGYIIADIKNVWLFFFFPIPYYLLPSFRLPPSLLFAEDGVSSGVALGIYEPVEAALPPGAGWVPEPHQTGSPRKNERRPCQMGSWCLLLLSSGTSFTSTWLYFLGKWAHHFPRPSGHCLPSLSPTLSVILAFPTEEGLTELQRGSACLDR